MRRLSRLPLAAAAVLVLAGCGTTNVNYVTGESQRGAYSWAQQVQLGAEADQQIMAQYGTVDDPELVAYVERLGQTVLSTSAWGQPETPAEVRNTRFYFRVLDTPVINAFALPGGYTYYTRGLLSHLDNEAQLAVVIGHEIGHVLAQHSSEQAARAQLSQLGVVGAAIIGGVVGGGQVAEGILNYGGTGAQLLSLKYGRDAEREADLAGVAYSEFADYDASEAAAFFRSLSRIQQQAGGALPSFLSTHPDPAEREQSIPQLAAQYEGTRIEQQAFMQQIAGIVMGDNPREGFVENGVFYHPDLAFRFDIPNGWQTQNSRQAVTIGESNGAAALQLTLAQGGSAAAAAQAFAQQQGVQISGSQNVSINGNSAVAFEGQAAQQQGTIAFRGAFIEYGGNVYQLLGLTSSTNYRSYVDAFNRTIGSFRTLTDAQYLSRQPVRLEVVRVDRTAPFQSFLAGRPDVPGIDANGLAILNQVELNQTVQAGTYLKLPR